MTDTPQLPPLPRVIWGVWVPGSGWLKVIDKSGVKIAYAEPRKEIAKRYAQWVGLGARVEPIDPSLVSIERELIAWEKERWAWRGIFNDFIIRKRTALVKRMGKTWATLISLSSNKTK